MAKATITMYDMAKQVAAIENPMDPIKFSREVNNVSDKMLQSNSQYWMLLCRERNDYSIFYLDTTKKKIISKELIPTLRNRGQVLVIDEQLDGAFEIWIRDPKTEENFAYYLFNYNNGIIKCVD